MLAPLFFQKIFTQQDGFPIVFCHFWTSIFDSDVPLITIDLSQSLRHIFLSAVSPTLPHQYLEKWHGDFKATTLMTQMFDILICLTVARKVFPPRLVDMVARYTLSLGQLVRRFCARIPLMVFSSQSHSLRARQRHGGKSPWPNNEEINIPIP